MEPPAAGALSIFRSRRMAVVFLLGFSSGLPLVLTGTTLAQWLIDDQVSLEQIAAFVWVGLAYSFKFAWAPLLDRFELPFLGRRRGWILVFQLALVGTLLWMASSDPADDPWRFAMIAVIVAFCSASQDVVIDAYTTDILEADERAAGAAVSVLGYRVAMLLAGSLALVLADHFSWHAVYTWMACAMAIGIAGTLLAVEPTGPERPPRTIAAAIVLPFRELWNRLGWRGALLLLGLAVTYKFGEQFAGVMTGAFYRREIGFTKTELGIANKAVGFAAIAIGGGIGGICVARYGLRRMLVVFGIAQALTHVAYLVIAIVGKNLPVFVVAIFIENASAAMATSAFVGALMAACSMSVSATQYALLTSLSSVGGRIFGPLAAGVVEWLGWKGFFLATIAMAIPGIVLAWFATPPERPLVLATSEPE
jgi:MFS transporter, PAT family, beta-lactamase induction signal transducer AmpG